MDQSGETILRLRNELKIERLRVDSYVSFIKGIKVVKMGDPLKGEGIIRATTDTPGVVLVEWPPMRGAVPSHLDELRLKNDED